MINVFHATIVYNCEYSGGTYVTIIKNDIYMLSMKVTLFQPFMIRLSGIEVEECPEFLLPNPFNRNNYVYFKDEKFLLVLNLDGRNMI